ncbi:MAG: hypothetical protein LBS33_05895, partial [Streptococcaceae bacterium]|nr:hypothetical protein [Streptococcaceae bacterium]
FKFKPKIFCIAKESHLKQSKLAVEIRNFLGNQVKVTDILEPDTQLIISETPVGGFLAQQNGGIRIYYISEERTKEDWKDLSVFVSKINFCEEVLN